jgi:hypothetical protein
LSETGDNFFANCRSSQIKIIGHGFQSIKKINDSFLADCENIQSIDFSNFINVESIGDYFMSNNKILTVCPGFAYFAKLTTIGDNFFNGNSNLLEFSCSGISSQKPGFVNVSSIGYNFLDETFNLRYVNLAALIKMKDNTTFISYLTNTFAPNLTPDATIIYPPI